MNVRQQMNAKKVLANQRMSKLMPGINEVVQLAIYAQMNGKDRLQGSFRLDI